MLENNYVASVVSSPSAGASAVLSSFEQTHGFVALNLGSGSVHLKGFIGVDAEPSVNPELLLDLTQGLKDLPDGSVDLIYSEHFIEHLDQAAHSVLIDECYRVLKPGGRIRLATPDLDYVVFKYLWDWKSQAWLNEVPWKDEVKTRGQMINRSMRDWGHQFLFNEEDLMQLLASAGFVSIIRFEYGASADARLADLETRPDSTLILEGVKYVP